MPTRRIPEAVAQEALDTYELTRSYVKGGEKLGLHRNTFEWRVKAAMALGMRPKVKLEVGRVYVPSRLGRMHLVIPDLQVRADVPTEHLEWIGNYIVEKKPDVIIQIGDWADMPSLNSHHKPLEKENQRYLKDIAAVRNSMERLAKPLDDYNRTAIEKYLPRRVVTKGNHEYRIQRTISEHPFLQKKIDELDLGFEDYGWEAHDFLEVVNIDGIEYSHYFTSGPMGRPVSSAAAMLRERQNSCTQGHVQYTDMAIHRKTQNIGLFCGICYLQDEPYLGPQGNNSRRQIIVKHEVEDGRYDPMFVSLKFLEKNYS